MPSKAPIDIDARLTEKFGVDEPEDDIPTVPVHLFGQDFMVRQDLNSFNLLLLSDNEENASAIARVMINAIIPTDRPRFKQALGSASRLTAEKLLMIFEQLVEAAAGSRPTVSSPVSRATTRKRAALPRSAGT